jgi:amino acid adenylation domain-containing protein
LSSHQYQSPLLEGVAIIGMAGRFPGARCVAEFWQNQVNGREAISQFSATELEVSNGLELSRLPNYVRARGVLEDVDLFDAEFFGIYPREAELMDPQHRLFLECCWQTFEDAGYDPAAYSGPIGVYAGSSVSTYFLTRLCTKPGFIQQYTGEYQVGGYPEMMGNHPDFLATRVSYKLNLRGPSFTMVSGCSTSLLAVTQACQSLLTYQNDMALAGGVSVTLPQKRGVLYQEGGMGSSDGHCRTFDADAQGTVFGGGVAVVLLKRLADAMRDGDQIYAVIRGFAANNDGSAKVGYTAPSVEGQARVIALAQGAADVHPEMIGYVEAHGTGTPLGDPIELSALTQAFRAQTKKKGFCTVGTAKTNIGHLDIAAGVTGLIHATHIVRHGLLPPTLHFKKPNPKFDLENSPFVVNTKLREWKASEGPRRAGVSAFGVGGTNAHIILEQAPDVASQAATPSLQLLVLSARSEAALERATDNLSDYLKKQPEVNLADVAWTLQVGRRNFSWRRTVVACNVSEAVTALSGRDRKRMQTRSRVMEKPGVYFLFPGQGSQHPNMGREIYATHSVFRKTVNRCAEILQPYLGVDLCKLLYPSDDQSEEVKRRVTETIVAQPAIFTIEYALAQLWMSWGVRPQAMIGHSIGELVAACLAGVLSLEDALKVVATRGRLMQSISAGGMLSIRLSEAEVRAKLNDRLALAAVNSPSLSVVAGPFDALEELEEQLGREGTPCKRLVTSHAFHSAMMDPILESFAACMAEVDLHTPQIPYVSSVTGDWVTEKQATDPAYWANHCRQTVQFSKGISELRKNATGVLLEVGPGNVLGTLTRQHIPSSTNQMIVSSLPDGYSGEGDEASLLNAVGSMWLAGVRTDWAALHGKQSRRRISLPTYPFERKRYWLEEPDQQPESPSVPIAPSTLAALSSEMNFSSTEAKKTVDISAQTHAIAVNKVSRDSRILSKLVEIFEKLSGMQLSPAEGSNSFLELGFDSLFLTQLSQALQDEFSLKITFRQLLGDQSSLNSLATYLDSNLPADVLAEPVVSESAAAVPADSIDLGRTLFAMSRSPAGVGFATGDVTGSPLERLIQDQLQAMNQLCAQQLAAVRGGAAVTQAASVAGGVVSVSKSQGETVALPVAASERERLANSSLVPAVEEFKPFGPYKPPVKSVSGELTDRQAKGLQSLIERYTKRTAKSKEFTEEYRQPLADPRVVAGFRKQWKELVYPIVTVRSEGPHLWDLDGNEYVDILNGFGPIFLGHRPTFVVAAIEEQLKKGFEIGPQTPLAGEVARKFCEMTGNERMTFCNTGSEAVMAALRVSRTVTGRKKVALFANAYHGMFDEVLVKGIKRAGTLQSLPVAPGIPQEKVENILVLDYGTEEALEQIRKNAKDLAAVIVEPVQSRHPEMVLPDYLKEIRRITEASGSAFIFDEVVTGFRTHPGGCQALFNIQADLATYGKVVAGGMPIGILAGKSKFMDALDGGDWHFGDDSSPEVGVTFFAGTFVRHPLALAAVKAVLEYFKEQGPALQERIGERATRMVRSINEFFEANAVPTRLANFKSLCYFTFPNEERFASLFYYYLRLKGIHVLEGFPCFLTTTHTDEDIEKIIRAFKESAIEMQEAGFFSAPAVTSPTVRADSLGVSTLIAVPAPMTEPQREVFLAASLGEDASCAFNESFSLRLRGPLNLDALHDALNTVISRHEALRATIDPEGTALHFLPELKLELPVCDLSNLELAAREKQAKGILDMDARTKFDLAKGPLVRASILRLAPDQHVLLFTSHHIVCDGWSTNVLMDELASLYSAKIQNREVELPPAVHFGEYARMQLAEKLSPKRTEVESYWLSQFKDVPPPLDLPVDRSRPVVKTYQGATYRTEIDAEGYRKIKLSGSKKGCTLFTTLLAGFQMLLHRLSRQDDIVVGIPAAGQSLLENGNLIGHCVNFLPLRSRFREDQSFAALLGEVKKTLLDAYEHQSYTYGTLVRKLALPLNPSRLPLMEVQFNLERVGTSTEFSGLNVAVDPNPKSAVNFDIFFNVVESDNGLTIDCDYNTDLFDEATIARWLNHYKVLLFAAVADPGKAIADLPIMTAVEVVSLLEAWNAHPTQYEVQETIQQVFEQRVSEGPDHIAVVLGGENLTYRDLNERANQLARVLRRKGIKQESIVGLCFERSLEMIVSFLAVLKAGGAYLPIDSSYPKERLTMMLEDARPVLLLTQDHLVKGLPAYAGEVISVDKEWPTIDGEEKSDLTPLARPENLAYIIYTSGSTGKPKGVMVTHANLVRLLKITEPWYHFNDQDVWTLFHTYSFDVSGWEIWGSLLTGGRLVIVPFWVTRSPQEFRQLLAKEAVTVLCQTPVAFYQLIQVEEAGYLEPLALRYVILAGEALNFANLRPWVKRHGDETPQLINMYGPTEATIYCSYRRLTKVEIEKETRSLIGVPVPDMNLYLLDSKRCPVPPGVVGEIYIAGAGVARGYLNRPELTAERFLPDPFTVHSGATMYRSGDVARFLSSGDIDFLGRMDRQVKIHGFRIELGEIEAVLAQHPAIREVAVMARKDGPGENKLVAYFVSNSAQKVSGAELSQFLQAKIPAHMIPYAFVHLESFPLNPNGKVDRDKLPAPDPVALARKREYIAPRSPEEKLLADILAEVLRVERVGVTDNLFELGADSLHVFQITSRAANAGMTITPRLLLQQRTIAGVVAEMNAAPATHQPQAPTIVPLSRQKYRVPRETPV